MSKDQTKTKILHITSHLGGGVGRALSSIVTYENEYHPEYIHKVLLLDKPEKHQFVNICKNGGVEVILNSDGSDIAAEMSNADIVVIHWWHHPVMAKFLCEFPPVKVRIVLWSHVNGCNYPCLPNSFVSLPQKTFFTSPFSYENPFWSEQERLLIKKSATVVYGLGKLDFYNRVERSRNLDKFVIGYVGTLNNSKLHPDFVDYCRAVLQKVPSAYFVMVGDSQHSNDILEKAKKYGIEDKFIFTGYSNQIVSELSNFDVFAYPLNPKHFGTTENALLEAMAFGLPVVALNHNAEKYIIKNHEKAGFLADSIEDYADCIKYLFDHPSEREQIGKNAKEYVINNYTFNQNVEVMRNELQKISNVPKRVFNFKKVFGYKPSDWFLSCLGEDEQVFRDSLDNELMKDKEQKEQIEGKIRNCSPILREKTKSSIKHFANTFSEDENLQYWEKLIDE